MPIKKKILVVEDERDLSAAIKLRLEEAGYSVVSAFDGEEALKILNSQKINLVLLDLIMPKKNGMEVLQEMKEKNISTPVIVTSNLGQDTEIKKALDLGAKEYFVKSNTSIDVIIRYVKKFLSSK